MKDLVFVTTALHTKWLRYQQKIIRKYFPKSGSMIIDGRKDWPNSWYYWIDKVKKSNKKYYIRIDEDFFITSREELLKSIDRMNDHDVGLFGCSDGFHHYRSANPVAINTFLMIGRVDDLKRLNVDLRSAKYQFVSSGVSGNTWVNDLGIKFDEKYGTDFSYRFEIQGGSSYGFEHEPYYPFLWSMKDIGCKFDYFYPYFDERFKSTNPRLEKDSPDIGIHMWYTRQWDSQMDVWGMPNVDRYRLVEDYINKQLI